MKLRTSSSQEEGAERDFAVMTRSSPARTARSRRCTASASTARCSRSPAPSSTLKADLVLLAMGFVGPVQEGMLNELGVELDQRGNVKADTDGYRTSRRQGLRLRRHAPRPVAGRLGDPRGPPGARARSTSILMGETTLPR